VTSKGVLWAWGNNCSGQLNIVGVGQSQIVPALVGAKDVFGGSPVHMVVCSYGSYHGGDDEQGGAVGLGIQ